VHEAGERGGRRGIVDVQQRAALHTTALSVSQRLAGRYEVGVHNALHSSAASCRRASERWSSASAQTTAHSPCENRVFPRQVIRARVEPDHQVAGDHRIREEQARQPVVGHARRTTDRGEHVSARPFRQQQDRMQPVVGGQRLIGAAAVADQVATLVTHLDVHNLDDECRRRLGEIAAVFEPELFDARQMPACPVGGARQVVDRRVNIRARVDTAAAVEIIAARCRSSDTGARPSVSPRCTPASSARPGRGESGRFQPRPPLREADRAPRIPRPR
jgi:hypothetical protein